MERLFLFSLGESFKKRLEKAAERMWERPEDHPPKKHL